MIDHFGPGSSDPPTTHVMELVESEQVVNRVHPEPTVFLNRNLLYRIADTEDQIFFDAQLPHSRVRPGQIQTCAQEKNLFL